MSDLEKIKAFQSRYALVKGPWVLTQLAGDVSSRRYYRLREEGAGQSCILALYPEPFDEGRCAEQLLEGDPDGVDGQSSRQERALTWANVPQAHMEATALLLGGGLPVPQILACDGALGLIAQEDVGDRWLQDEVRGQNEDIWLNWYQRAVDLIFDMQNCQESALNQGSFATCLSLNQPKLRWELDYFARHFWFDEGLSATSQSKLDSSFDALCKQAASYPQSLCHRDYHARNLMVEGTPARLWIIDHQDLRLGSRVYDLVSLLEDPYTRPPRRVVEQLYAYSARRMGIPLIELQDEINSVMAQRLLKACGTYACQVNVRGNQAFMGYLAPTISRAIEALKLLNGFEALIELLEQKCPA